MQTGDVIQRYFENRQRRGDWTSSIADDVVFTREVQPPAGMPAFTSDVAEIFTVRDDHITSFAIYFDTAPFPK